MLVAHFVEAEFAVPDYFAAAGVFLFALALLEDGAEGVNKLLGQVAVVGPVFGLSFGIRLRVIRLGFRRGRFQEIIGG